MGTSTCTSELLNFDCDEKISSDQILVGHVFFVIHGPIL